MDNIVKVGTTKAKTDVGTWVNTTLFVYADTVENYEVVTQLSDIQTTNQKAKDFATNFFSEDGRQRLILKAKTTTYEATIGSVADQFLYCCSDAEGVEQQRLLEYCRNQPFLFLFFFKIPNIITIPESDNLIGVVTGYKEGNFVSTLYPIVDTVDMLSNAPEPLDAARKTLVGFSTEGVISAILAADVISTFNAPNKEAISQIGVIFGWLSVYYDQIFQYTATLTNKVNLLIQLEGDLAQAPDPEKPNIQAQIDLIRQDIVVLLGDLVVAVSEAKTLSDQAKVLVANVKATLPEDTPPSIVNDINDLSDLIDSTSVALEVLEGQVATVDTASTNNATGQELLAIITPITPTLSNLITTGNAVQPTIDSILIAIAFEKVSQEESISNTLVVLDPIRQTVLQMITSETSEISNTLTVLDAVRTQVLISNTMENVTVLSSITPQDITRT